MAYTIAYAYSKKTRKDILIEGCGINVRSCVKNCAKNVAAKGMDVSDVYFICLDNSAHKTSLPHHIVDGEVKRYPKSMTTMKTELFNNFSSDRVSWVEVYRTEDNIVAEYKTRMQGDSDKTYIFRLSDEAALVEGLNHPCFTAAAFEEGNLLPDPIKTINHRPVR